MNKYAQIYSDSFSKTALKYEPDMAALDQAVPAATLAGGTVGGGVGALAGAGIGGTAGLLWEIAKEKKENEKKQYLKSLLTGAGIGAGSLGVLGAGLGGAAGYNAQKLLNANVKAQVEQGLLPLNQASDGPIANLIMGSGTRKVPIVIQ